MASFAAVRGLVLVHYHMRRLFLSRQMDFTHVAADLDLQHLEARAEVRLEHPVENLRPLWLLVRKQERGGGASAAQTATISVTAIVTATA